MDNKSLSHVRWKCQYHIVFIPKYRKKVLYGKLKADVRDIISTLCRYKDVEIIDGAVCEDHIHLSVAIPPKYSISKFMGYLKGKSTLMIYRQLENPETVPEISEEKEEESQTVADAQEADSEQNTENSAQKDKAGEESGERESETRTEETKQPSPSASDKKIKEKNEQSLSETEDTSAAQDASAAALPHPEIDLAPETLADYNYLLNNFFIVDPKTATSEQQLNAASFLGKDLTLEKNADVPQILIYHSHSQETFVDSREGRVEDTIVGVGDYLTQLLTETYGYQVIHVTETFDIVDGQIDRSAAYDYARPYIEQILEENPSIEVVIDLHRDGVPEDRHLVTEINGKPTAQIMFYNGLSYTADGGQVDYLPNPYIQDNLAFSFQLEYQAAQYYPELYRGIYLAALRYNLHLRPRVLLLEAGAQTNTVQEVKNAMEPFADILNRVLTGA